MKKKPLSEQIDSLIRLALQKDLKAIYPLLETIAKNLESFIVPCNEGKTYNIAEENMPECKRIAEILVLVLGEIPADPSKERIKFFETLGHRLAYTHQPEITQTGKLLFSYAQLELERQKKLKRVPIHGKQSLNSINSNELIKTRLYSSLRAGYKDLELELKR